MKATVQDGGQWMQPWRCVSSQTRQKRVYDDGMRLSVNSETNPILTVPAMLNSPIQFYSCFISYSSQDDEFARRLHADLQDNGVRCWFAPEDLKIGDRVLFAIDEAIRLRDKLMLVLSEASIESDWVEHEVNKALQEEEKRGATVLFPIRIDGAVMKTEFGWAKRIRQAHRPTGRHIGDFSNWKDHDEYKIAFDRLMRDLKNGAER